MCLAASVSAARDREQERAYNTIIIIISGGGGSSVKIMVATAISRSPRQTANQWRLHVACLRNGIPWPHKRLLAPASNGFYARLEHFERLFMSLCASRLSRFFPHYLLMTCKCISASSHHCPFTIYVCDSISLITLELSTMQKKKIAISCARLCHCFRYSFQMALKTFRSILSSFFSVHCLTFN